MPTIKDIAVKAGVSHGTVSNVLNKRGNVSAEKIQLVEQAARELGYKVNMPAQQLRTGTARKVCVILPGISPERYNDLYFGLEQYLRDQDFTIELICTNNLEHYEEAAIKKALSINSMAIVIVSSVLKNYRAFGDGTGLIFAERIPRRIPVQSLCVTFDFSRAGREIALKCVRDNRKNIAFLCENSRYSDSRDFLGSASAVLEEWGCSYRILPGNDGIQISKAFDILMSKEDFDAVVAMSREDIIHLYQAHGYHRGKPLPAIYSLTGKGLGRDLGLFCYELNYKLLGHTIAKKILHPHDGPEPSSSLPLLEADKKDSRILYLENDGFSPSVFSAPKKNRSLNFLTIQNLTSRAIGQVLEAFAEETGIHVNMIEMSYDELYKMAQASTSNCPYDLIRIDMAWMAELGETIFAPLPESDDRVTWLKGQMIPTLSLNYSNINQITYALPLDVCIQMLFYRRDLFEDELVKREFFELYRRRLEPPKSFDEFNEVAAFFTRSQNEKSRTRYGATATYGRTFLASCDFLPRFRAMETSIFDKNGRVNIQTPHMRKAIQSYLDTCRCTDGGIYQWWRDVTHQFSEGNTAMHIVFSNYASEMLHNPESKVVGKIAYSPVPGGQPLTGGGSIGISRYSSKYEESIEFLTWLYSRKTAETVTYLGGYICNREIHKDIGLLGLYPWLEDMEGVFKPGWRFYTHEKNPAFNEFIFEDILGKALRSIASGIEDVDSALKKAQAECLEAFS